MTNPTGPRQFAAVTARLPYVDDAIGLIARRRTWRHVKSQLPGFETEGAK